MSPCQVQSTKVQRIYKSVSFKRRYWLLESIWTPMIVKRKVLNGVQYTTREKGIELCPVEVQTLEKENSTSFLKVYIYYKHVSNIVFFHFYVW